MKTALIKILSLITVMSLIFALFAGCGSSSSSSSSSDDDETTAEEATTEEAEEEAEEADAEEVETEEAEEETTEAAEEAAESEAEETTEAAMEETTEEETGDEAVYSALLPAPDGTELSFWFIAEMDGVLEDFNDNAVAQIYEEETNVHVNYIMVSNIAGETQFNLILASGDLPDIMDSFCTLYTAGGDSAIDEEFIYDLSDYIEYMPNYYQIINENEETMLTAHTDSGAIAGFFTVGADAELGPRGGHYIRADWLEELGMDVPVTYDDYYDVLMAFKTEYNCSFAYMLGSTGIPDNSCLTAGYETSSTFMNKDGQVVYGPLEEGFEDFLAMMHQWYEDGLISSDFVSTGTGMSLDTQAIATGEYGIWNAFYRSDDSWKEAATDPDFEPLAIADAVLEEGQQLHTGGTTGAMGKYGASVTTSCDDPAMAVSWIDAFYSEEHAALNSYGIEGYTFTYNEDGQPIYTDVVLNSEEGSARDMRFKYTIMFSARMLRVVSTSEDKQYDVIDRGTWQSNRDATWDIPSTIELSTEEGSTYSAIMSDIETYVEECVPAFITGSKDLSEYDSFCEEIYAMGIEDAIDIYQAALDRYNARSLD